MKDYCFFMCYYPNYSENVKWLKNSIRKFYPDAPIIEDVTVGGFDLKAFCDRHLEVGLKLLDEYKRVISLDPDEIMCAPCPDLFGDFDMGVVQNNVPFEIPDQSPRGNVYINAGMTVCTNKEVWKEWMERYGHECVDHPGEGLNEQNALNLVFHKSPFNVQLLEFPDRVYGISVMDYGYPNMYIKDDELWATWTTMGKKTDKKVCLFHAAGVDWKKKETGEYNYGLIHDQLAQQKLRSFTKGVE